MRSHYYEKANARINPQLADGYIGIGIVKDLTGKNNSGYSLFSKSQCSLQPDNDNYQLVLR